MQEKLNHGWMKKGVPHVQLGRVGRETLGLLALGLFWISGIVCLQLKDRLANACPDKLVPMDTLSLLTLPQGRAV